MRKLIKGYTMKAIIFSCIILALSIISLNASACMCDKEPMMQEPVIIKYVQKRFQEKINESDIQALKYYSTNYEKLLAYNDASNSCFGEEFDGSPIYQCSRSRKYLYSVVIPAKNCEIELKVKTTFKRSKVKLVKSTCN